jgi:hypothetical protein
VGIKQVSDQIWLVTFMDYDLGHFDHETCRLEPLENSFGPKVLNPVTRSNGSCGAPRPMKMGSIASPWRL